jgi:hypothetical protein
MKLMPIAGLAALIVAGAGSAALAQSDPNYPSGYNPNVQADQNYQAQKNAYDSQMDATARAQDDYAQQRGAYDQNAADYQAERRAYKHRLREYERARADYDALYGPGAYERVYPVPVAPY